jgi:hypothetical protein
MEKSVNYHKIEFICVKPQTFRLLHSVWMHRIRPGIENSGIRASIPLFGYALNSGLETNVNSGPNPRRSFFSLGNTEVAASVFARNRQSGTRSRGATANSSPKSHRPPSLELLAGESSPRSSPFPAYSPYSWRPRRSSLEPPSAPPWPCSDPRSSRRDGERREMGSGTEVRILVGSSATTCKSGSTAAGSSTAKDSVCVRISIEESTPTTYVAASRQLC